MRILSNKKGFTLIEMLIVVVIIGVLAAIILPRMTGSSQSAKNNACKANVAAINQTLELLAFEKNIGSSSISGDFPTTGNAVTAFPAGSNTIGVEGSILQTYFPDGGIICPVGSGAASKYVIVAGRVKVDDAAAPHTH